jgi:Ca2+-binding RTX toxin-like protein
VVGVAVGAVVISALAATNVVPTTRAALQSNAITVDQLKPKPECNGITVTVLRAGVNGGAGNDLVLGTAAANNPLRGNGGNDCIHGGGGADLLRGDAGTDVCIGGPGTDTFHASCETSIQ